MTVKIQGKAVKRQWEPKERWRTRMKSLFVATQSPYGVCSQLSGSLDPSPSKWIAPYGTCKVSTRRSYKTPRLVC